MNIHIDTSSLSPAQAHGLIALLSTLFPQPGQTQAHTSSYSSSVLTQMPAIVPDEPAMAAEPAPMQELTPRQPEAQPADQAPPQAVTRHRRTKAQIAADEAAKPAGGAENPTQGSAAPDAVASGTTQSVTAETSTAPAASASQIDTPSAKTVTADGLRALLNGYISRHSMDDAIKILKSFNCNRVTEALSLEAAKLHELATVLNG